MRTEFVYILSYASAADAALNLQFVWVAVLTDNLDHNGPIGQFLGHVPRSGQRAWNTNAWTRPQDPQDTENK